MEVQIVVLYAGKTWRVALPEDATLEKLARLMKERHAPHVDLATVKFLHKGKTLRLGDTLARAGVRGGGKLQMLAPIPREVEAVRGARDLPGMAGFDHELQREQRRQAPAAGPPAPPAGPHAFQRFEAWQRAGLHPAPSEALKLLQQLAADRGIAGVMARHQWRVSTLSEMPPEGKVGVSPVCILGVNINRGQEVSLRLRTDDLKGFRRYDRIRETLIHELAHMVHSEHDNAFKELNSQLRREAELPAAQRLAASGASGGAPTLGAPPPPPPDAMAATAASSGKTLREMSGEEVSSGPADARAAAAGAALRRAGGAGPASHPLEAAAQPFAPKKGDVCEYRQRDGSWVAAKVASVDVGIVPPSYGIELRADDGGTSYRETEGGRLRAAPAAAGGAPAVEGLGHVDHVTEAKEAAVRALEE